MASAKQGSSPFPSAREFRRRRRCRRGPRISVARWVSTCRHDPLSRRETRRAKCKAKKMKGERGQGVKGWPKKLRAPAKLEVKKRAAESYGGGSSALRTSTDALRHVKSVSEYEGCSLINVERTFARYSDRRSMRCSCRVFSWAVRNWEIYHARKRFVVSAYF